MRFVNERWIYPGSQPKELQNLPPSAEGFLSPILVFCELTNSRSRLTRTTRAGHHFVSGRIGLYKNTEFLGANVGTRGLVKISDKAAKLKASERKKIRKAWKWLKKMHPLIKEMDIDDPRELLNATESMRLQESDLSGRTNVNVSGLRAYHMGPIDTGGPRTADESQRLENMAIGIQGRDQKLVKYSNPCLLGYLFPTLYPRGKGFFSLDYDGIQNTVGQEVQYHEGKIFYLYCKY